MTSKDWYKYRGYLHLTPPVSRSEVLQKVTNPAYIVKHAFLPLLKYDKIQRRYKKVKEADYQRVHSYWSNGEKVKTRKARPIEFATHIDAHIFAYYAINKIRPAYELELSRHDGLLDCICAYRQIPATDNKGMKSNIHVANEVFEYIRNKGECVCLAFDIDSFFPSLDHLYLKKRWAELLESEKLPDDHYSLYKAVTKYSWIETAQFRTGRNRSYDERYLAQLRNEGIHAFFRNAGEFGQAVKQGRFRIYKNRDKGIPHGLPISAHLANLYLLEFDKIIYEMVVKKLGGFYRRYSDDIIVICNKADYQMIKTFVENSIQLCKLSISPSKTDIISFDYNEKGILKSGRILTDGTAQPNIPLVYLGFEYYGDRILIKSANISKLYRRMKQAVARKKKHIEKALEKNPTLNPVLWKRKLYRQFSYLGQRKYFYFAKSTKMEYDPESDRAKQVSKPKRVKKHGNFFTYAYRAASITDDSSIRKQLKRHWRILGKTVEKYFGDDG